MEIRRARVDLASIERANANQKHLISVYRRRLKMFDEDKKRKERLAESLCKVCYYQDSRIGASVCTSQQCGLCDEVLQFGNTCTDKLCQKCSKANGLCRHCGADIGYVNKRKRKLPSIK